MQRNRAHLENLDVYDEREKCEKGAFSLDDKPRLRHGVVYVEIKRCLRGELLHSRASDVPKEQDRPEQRERRPPGEDPALQQVRAQPHLAPRGVRDPQLAALRDHEVGGHQAVE